MHGIEEPVRSGTATTLELPRGTVTFLFTDIEAPPDSSPSSAATTDGGATWKPIGG